MECWSVGVLVFLFQYSNTPERNYSLKIIIHLYEGGELLQNLQCDAGELLQKIHLKTTGANPTYLFSEPLSLRDKFSASNVAE
jgi:hypothetical protein